MLIPGFNPGVFTGAGNNTWLIAGREPALIDAATGAGRHLAGLRDALGPARLARVLVTHGHPDHASGAAAIAAEWPGTTFAKMPDDGDDRYPVDWQPLADGDLVPAGGGVLRVLHTPGHARDHVCFLDEAADTLYSGDLLVSGSSVVIPASAGGSLTDYLASLARVRALRPARVLPGHGPEIRDVVPLIDHYVAHRARRDEQILAALAGGAATREAVVARVYSGLAEGLVRAAGESVLAHLVKLEAEGRVRRLPGEEGEWEAANPTSGRARPGRRGPAPRGAAR